MTKKELRQLIELLYKFRETYEATSEVTCKSVIITTRFAELMCEFEAIGE